jgi:[acyl-carrier-protein] S-malonyltransferase
MEHTAFLFPGQGSQAVGMGRDLAENTEAGRRAFARADEILGFPLSRICFSGPEEELKLTSNTQPALLVVSHILFQLLGRVPAVAAGHSLGEYSALLCAGAFSFDDAVLAVHRRGKYMQEAVPVGQGAMAAVLGVGLEAIRAALAEVGGMVDIANWNSSGQVVISGEKAAVEAAVARIAAPKSVFLPVSAPFHSRLMQPAEERLAADLARIPFSDLLFPVINNVDVATVTTAAAARDGLVRQVSRPVLWHATMEKLLVERGITRLVEIGSGKVLGGIARKTAKEFGRTVEVTSLETLADLQKFAAVP